jgi:hypothetical protein
MSESNVLRRMVRIKSGKVKGQLKILHCEEFLDFFALSVRPVIRVVKWAVITEHVARIGGTNNSFLILVNTPL